MYRYGAIFGYLSISYVLAVVYTSEVFLPVFYRLAINSTYEVTVVLFSTLLLALPLNWRAWGELEVWCISINMRLFCLVSAKYLELRFSRATRLLAMVIFFFNAVRSQWFNPCSALTSAYKTTLVSAETFLWLSNSLPQLLYTGLVIYAPALALNQGMSARVSNSQVREGILYESVFPVNAFPLSLQWLVWTCGVGLFRQPLFVLCIVHWLVKH